MPANDPEHSRKDESGIARQFVDAAIESDTIRSTCGPVLDIMLDPDRATSKGGWWPWRPCPSTVTDADLQKLEKRFGGPLPPAFRDFLKYCHFCDITAPGIRFEPHLPGRWMDEVFAQFEGLRKILDPKVLLVPFGSESNDAGAVGFDFMRRSPDGDCPVIFWDHDRTGTDGEVQLMFSSAERMFTCLHFALLNHEHDFIYVEAGDSEEIRARKRELLETFLALDPEGAGGAGRDYWTMWHRPPAPEPATRPSWLARLKSLLRF